MASISELLHDGSPFAGLDLSAVPSDLTGWGSTHPVFAAAINHYRPKVIIEVGSWKGGSAIHMANTLRDAGIDGEIVCVDTWLGAPIAWTTEPGLKPSLRLTGGYPQLYYTFARNVTDAGLGSFITPLPASSDGGFTILKHFGIRADVIYIDADHDYAAVKRDLENYFELLTPAGMLIGDDFGCFPGVTLAVKEFAEAHDLYAVKMREKIALSRIDIASVVGLQSDGYYERARAA